jgi:hypothetical protein
MDLDCDQSIFATFALDFLLESVPCHDQANGEVMGDEILQESPLRA